MYKRQEEIPVRGGTDGAVLSWKGLPCPNLGTGGFNFHEMCIRDRPKPCRNQMATVASRMTEPARLMKDQPRSQVARKKMCIRDRR